ncbi:peptidylprolyl isomerase family protein FPR2 KNAG_0F00200 [Huiozyma naganishii CBS 8797]|uniref:peptidylprolyl isomerase n=1 Tax=Huiozyma naganishii (strain ATCC MYA-139 / BCRC 22969 / CBS 8797 / KCTC 17520 / NBRC 10181 / NCYC 3082 / Yp74L-3) TaxID=1071383 RepID=J7RZN0_HUIN7|nr:hypothetical protein KNAG_0F00200 [Kazachstania naganishii CBS 8797]CCK70692.1 hypothetical protein KNAG_0F00200 [Kazachstania naganishii CBS 8797]
MRLSAVLLPAVIGRAFVQALDDVETTVLSGIPEAQCPTKAAIGDLVTVEYVGKLLADNSTFDATKESDGPFKFVIGSSHIIPGMEKGIVGMCIGEKRSMKIPSSMAYGERGFFSVIPPNADLIFDVRLIDAVSSKTD